MGYADAASLYCQSDITASTNSKRNTSHEKARQQTKPVNRQNRIAFKNTTATRSGWWPQQWRTVIQLHR